MNTIERDLDIGLQRNKEAGICHCQRFGECPECEPASRTYSYTNVGKKHWFYCEDHKTMWGGGYNLFSSWQYETEDEQREKWEKIALPGFREVNPRCKPCSVCERQRSAEEAECSAILAKQKPTRDPIADKEDCAYDCLVTALATDMYRGTAAQLRSELCRTRRGMLDLARDVDQRRAEVAATRGGA